MAEENKHSGKPLLEEELKEFEQTWVEIEKVSEQLEEV